MPLDLGLTTTNELIIILETKAKTKVIKLQEGELTNLFFFLIKRKLDLFSKISDEELKSSIIQILVQKPEETKEE